MQTLFWLDVETTGLNPKRDRILELAIRQTASAYPFVGDMTRTWVFRDDGFGLDEVVHVMHTKNGLLRDCQSPQAVTVRYAENVLLDMVPDVEGKDDKPVLAGSAVHTDLAFLRESMPRLAVRFSHRLYDVTAIKLFCRSLGMPRLPRPEAHRAAADIAESIEHAQACATWLKNYAATAVGAPRTDH